MTRNWLLSHWRRMVMQGTLVLLLAVTVALAALTAQYKLRALRLPMGSRVTVGRLSVPCPLNWSVTKSDPTNLGETVSCDELLSDGRTRRRLSVYRIRTAGMVSPLEQLMQTPYVKDADLAENNSAHSVHPVKIQNIEVARWPGTMIIRTVIATGGSRHKQLLACAVLPPAQAVLIKLEGPDEPDEADEELVRQLAETVQILESGKDSTSRENASVFTMRDAGGMIELDGGIFASVPPHFCKLPEDADRTARDLLCDSAAGHWARIELIPCIWTPGDDERTFQSLLTAHDRDWQKGPCKKLSDVSWHITRPGTTQFPTHAYCLTNGTDQAVIAIMHGDRNDATMFDPAWKTIAASIRFTSTRDIAGMLANGRDKVAQIKAIGVEQLLKNAPRHEEWSLWDKIENADKQPWMRLDMSPVDTVNTDEPITFWKGTSQTYPVQSMLGRLPGFLVQVYGSQPINETHQNSWKVASDLSFYHLAADRFIVVGNQAGPVTTTQRWELSEGSLRNLLSVEDAKSPPEQYIPSGLLPFILGNIATTDQPMIIRTETFIGCEGNNQDLLTLIVQRVTNSTMPCVTVTVNGTGQTTRWYYDLDGTLRYIDFARALRAQRTDNLTK